MYNCYVNHYSGSFRKWISWEFYLTDAKSVPSFIWFYYFNTLREVRKPYVYKFCYGWTDKWHKAKRGVQIGPIIGHKFHSLRLLELFSCAFITKSQEWRLYWRTDATTCNCSQKSVPISSGLQKTWNKSFERDMFGWAGFSHGCLTSVKEGFVIEVIYSSTQCTRKNEMMHGNWKLLTFCLAAIKTPSGRQKYWKENRLLNIFYLFD